MRTVIIVVLILLNMELLFSQCKQDHSNSLFSCQTVLLFVDNFDKAEEKLLSYDFCLAKTTEDNGITTYQYRIDHSLQSDLDYMFDIFAITNGSNRIEYCTCSNRNFIAYKKRMIDCGFKKSPNDKYYKKVTSTRTYYMNLERSVYSSGDPNYNIIIWFY